jgi:hypothetical protein
MTLDQSMMDESEELDFIQTQPKPELGLNFSEAAYPTLLLSTKSRVWGDPFPQAIEPPEFEADHQDLKNNTLAKDSYRCMYCGFYSQRNQIHNLSNNHRDIRPENLRTADPFCHAWQHLGELGEGNAVIAYLPGLSGQDVNHLQRTIMVALQSEDVALQADAKKLLDWLTSHRDYTETAWHGVSDPIVFADALVRLEQADLINREFVLEDLALIFDPVPYRPCITTLKTEAYVNFPYDTWGQVSHNIINAPA